MKRKRAVKRTVKQAAKPAATRTAKRRAKPAANRRTKPAKGKAKPVAKRRPLPGVEDRGEVVALASEMAAHPGTGPVLSGGDVDADWTRAHLSGEEAVGGSVATPDQDVVDEIGRALGVEQEADAPVRTSDEMLRDRDRLRWHLEREAADEDEKRAAHRRRRE
jgi:hypothetical protein